MASTQPAALALQLASAITACSGPSEQYLEWLRETDDASAAAAGRITFARFAQCVEKAIELAQEPALGLLIGAGAPVSRYGALGLAIYTASTMREAMRLVERFGFVFGDGARVHLFEQDGIARVELEEMHPLAPVREFIVFALFSSFVQIGTSLTGKPPPRGHVELAFPEPAYFERFRTLFPGEVRFDQPVHAIVFDAAQLDLPILSADTTAARSAIEQCERELAARSTVDPVLADLHSVLDRHAPALPSLSNVARELGMAERSLKRRLAQRGTSFSELVDSRRHRAALELLRAGHAVEEIAEQLGYSDAANFTRAFRRWTGKSPRAMRRP
jgi:AraC-like DNA-binding protein